MAEKVSYQSSGQSTSPCLPLWWNPTRAQLPHPSISRNFNLSTESPTQQYGHSKQAGVPLHDQDSSSSQSTGQSYHDMQAYNEAYGKGVQSAIKSVLSLGTLGYGFPHTQMDGSHSHPFVTYAHMEPYFGGAIPAYPSPLEIHPYMFGASHARMPLPLDITEDRPVYVNAKQYRGILKRRLSRAKLECQNKLLRGRKPYLHESRHLHAMKRARGTGGRFLNTKKLEKTKVAADNQKILRGASLHLGSLSDSEVVQSDNGVASSGNSGSATSTSEVTSISPHDHLFQRADFLFPGFHPQTGGVTQVGGTARGGSLNMRLPLT